MCILEWVIHRSSGKLSVCLNTETQLVALLKNIRFPDFDYEELLQRENRSESFFKYILNIDFSNLTNFKMFYS